MPQLHLEWSGYHRNRAGLGNSYKIVSVKLRWKCLLSKGNWNSLIDLSVSVAVDLAQNWPHWRFLTTSGTMHSKRLRRRWRHLKREVRLDLIRRHAAVQSSHQEAVDWWSFMCLYIIWPLQSSYWLWTGSHQSSILSWHNQVATEALIFQTLLPLCVEMRFQGIDGSIEFQTTAECLQFVRLAALIGDIIHHGHASQEI